MNREEILLDLRKNLKPSRFEHTLGVEKKAIELYNQLSSGSDGYKADFDLKQLSLAAVLHDCAKYLSVSDMLELIGPGAATYKLGAEAFPVLHAFAGAEYAKKYYGIEDALVLDAIRFHTTGRPGMNALEMIVFCSDYIEDGRPPIPSINEARKRASKIDFKGLENLTRYILSATVSYLKNEGKITVSLTEEALEYYNNKLKDLNND